MIDILKDISNRIDSYYVYKSLKNDRDYTYIHPSSIGYCIRRIYYDMTVIAIDRQCTDPKTLRIFDNGHKYHERLSEELKAIGVLVRDEVPLHSSNLNIHGHTDGIAIIQLGECDNVCAIIEGKSAGSWSFNNQLKESVDNKHLYQTTLYMMLSGLKYTIIIIENKDNQDRMYIGVKLINKDIHVTECHGSTLLREYVVSDIVSEILTKIHTLNYHLESKEPPDNPYNDCNKQECKWCNYKDRCY